MHKFSCLTSIRVFLSLFIVVLFLKSSLQQGSDAILTVDVEPSNELNYTELDNGVFGVAGSVTFRLQPPCPSASIFSHSEQNKCVFGPACPLSRVFFEEGPAGASFRVDLKNSSQQLLANGLYFAQCPSQNLTYEASNLELDINPRIIKMAVYVNPINFYPLVRSLSNTSGHHIFIRNSVTIHLDERWGLGIHFGVGKGRHGQALRDDITLSVPDFDQPEGAYSFAKKISGSYLMLNVTPPGKWFQYRMYSIADLARENLCYIQGRAVAYSKEANFPDIVYFNFTVGYAPIVAAILVEREHTPHGCQCLFTCKVAVCPNDQRVSIAHSEWTFSTDVWMERQYRHGNVPGRRDQYLLPPAHCQAALMAARADPEGYKIYCRVVTSIAGSQIVEHGESVYHLLRNCNETEFQCANHYQCIPAVKHCNGRQDCIDGTDEVNCQILKCEFGDFECKSLAGSICLPPYRVCDGVDDCGDNSDENICHQKEFINCTSKYQFACTNGKCIWRSYLCNGKNDCGDESDETSEICDECPQGRIHCNNSLKCIYDYRLCDGKDDCGDRSDEAETLCGPCSLSNLRYPRWRCLVSNHCISMSHVCDGQFSCSYYRYGDDSDESHEACSMVQETKAKPQCPPETVRCTSTPGCIPRHKICDGVVDCCPINATEINLPFNRTHIGDCEKTDEIGCAVVENTTCSVNNGGCSHGCMTIFSEDIACGEWVTRTGGEIAYCTCRQGYRRPFEKLTSCIAVGGGSAAVKVYDCNFEITWFILFLFQNVCFSVLNANY